MVEFGGVGDVGDFDMVVWGLGRGVWVFEVGVVGFI